MCRNQNPAPPRPSRNALPLPPRSFQYAWACMLMRTSYGMLQWTDRCHSCLCAPLEAGGRGCSARLAQDRGATSRRWSLSYGQCVTGDGCSCCHHPVSQQGRMEPWFHGPISRVAAEQLLKGQVSWLKDDQLLPRILTMLMHLQPVGAFLLRVSTRIWGYTLSFVDRQVQSLSLASIPPNTPCLVTATSTFLWMLRMANIRSLGPKPSG